MSDAAISGGPIQQGLRFGKGVASDVLLELAERRGIEQGPEPRPIGT
jgi:hypothetical protein